MNSHSPKRHGGWDWCLAAAAAVDVAELMGAQRIIAVQLTGDLPRFTLPTDPTNGLARLTRPPRHFAVLSRALAVLMAQANVRPVQHAPALLVRPDVHHIGTLDMSRPEAGQHAGEAAARAATAELLALRAWRLESPAPARLLRPRATPIPA